MQTILGAGGSIGREIAKILPAFTDKIRLASRNPKAVNPTDMVFSCDLTDKTQVLQAVKGSEIAFLVAGLEYNTLVWQEKWPVVIANTIEACKKHDVSLVFFDNVYMYDPKHIPHMTEETPVNPSSKKGELRAKIARMLMEEAEKGNINALIARSADFYGPGVSGSIIMNGVYEYLKKGKRANWFCSLNYKHSATYTPDAARATAQLGNTKISYGQVWHVPTTPNPPTGQQWIEMFASALQTKPKSMIAPKPLVKVLGWFDPMLKEMHEMLYQYDRDYIFDSSKFDNIFGIPPTPYHEGISRVVLHRRR
jgi:nucleoside-diphosphate-sugar epimerase